MDQRDEPRLTLRSQPSGVPSCCGPYGRIQSWKCIPIKSQPNQSTPSKKCSCEPGPEPTTCPPRNATRNGIPSSWTKCPAKTGGREGGAESQSPTPALAKGWHGLRLGEGRVMARVAHTIVCVASCLVARTYSGSTLLCFAPRRSKRRLDHPPHTCLGHPADQPTPSRLFSLTITAPISSSGSAVPVAYLEHPCMSAGKPNSTVSSSSRVTLSSHGRS